MNAKKFKRIIYLISATVLITVAIQVYRNVQNYQINKERLVLDMQQALDLSVESYYANLAKENVIIYTSDSLRVPFNFRSRINMQGIDGVHDTVIRMKSSRLNQMIDLRDFADANMDTSRVAFFSSTTSISDSSLRISASDISSISVTSEITNADTLNDLVPCSRK